jgi:hypothetical protein
MNLEMPFDDRLENQHGSFNQALMNLLSTFHFDCRLTASPTWPSERNESCNIRCTSMPVYQFRLLARVVQAHYNTAWRTLS